MSRKRKPRSTTRGSKTTVPSNGAKPVAGRTPAQSGVRPIDVIRAQRLEQAAAYRRRQRLVRWGAAIGLAVAAVVIVALLALRSDSEPSRVAAPDGLPGPRGGPSVAQDVNTLVGQPAPAFTLSDSEGTSYEVTPGQGRPTVLVFHMGIT
jgi:hypothetical protein